MRHGGNILVDQLAAHGVDRVFSVPGESFLAVLDALYDSGIENTVCRHEGGAAFMAEAMGKISGRPGVAFVTRGPGATNASCGVHVAMQDSTPMILFVGQIARDHRDREAFQELNYRAVFGSMAKWVAEIDQTDRIPEYVNRAFHIAMSGRPGPVVLALPEDMLSAASDAVFLPPTAAPHVATGPSEAVMVVDQMRGAQRPLVIVGGGQWTTDGSQALAQFAETQGVPVATVFRRGDIMDNRHPNYVGDLGVGMNPALAKRLRDADCLVLLGARMGDIASGGYSLVDPAQPNKKIVHVHPSPDLPGTVFRTDLAVVARATDLAAHLVQQPKAGDWAAWTASARADLMAWRTPQETPGAVKLEQIVGHLSQTLPEDAIITNGAGNYCGFVHRYFEYKGKGTQISPTSGTMGYGFPAAVAASLRHPDRQVVCFAGDGCFQMTLNEMSTAVQYGAKPIVIVANNGRYGTIRMHQENSYPGRVSGTDMYNPDFAALARAYGAHGEVVHETAEFAQAFARAAVQQVPSVIELRLDPNMLSTTKSIGE